MCDFLSVCVSVLCSCDDKTHAEFLTHSLPLAHKHRKTRMEAHTRTHRQTCLHAHIRTDTHAQTYTHTHTQADKYTHICFTILVGTKQLIPIQYPISLTLNPNS